MKTCTLCNEKDYCVTMMLQQLVARNFAKNGENIKRELRVIISFCVIVCYLVPWRSKKVF